MKECGHLQSYTLCLKAVGPLFIGAGKKYSKVDYTLNQYGTMMYILDERRLADMLVRCNLVDMYESYIIGTPAQSLDMYYFLRKLCGLSQSDIKALVRFWAATGGQTADRHAVEVDQFVKNARGEIYLPGSSVKGALRTALLTDMILEHPTPAERRRPWNPLGRRRESDDAARTIESDYLHTLHCGAENRNDAVNSLLRGLFIADSDPLPANFLTLCRKIDVAPDGYTSSPNLIRECIKPGSEIRMTLTLDQSVLQNRIIAESLLKSLRRWTAFYHDVYLSHFKVLPQGAVCVNYKEKAGLLLGGGGGFFGKTITYPYYANPKEEYPYDEARGKVTSLLSGKFPRIKRDREQGTGIAPAMLKYAEIDGRAYPMSWCEVNLK